MKNYLFGILSGLWACKEPEPIPVVPDTSQKNTELTIYPAPPTGWMGTSNPYNTTGWVGDLMPFFDNGKFHLFFLHDAQHKPAGKGFHDIHKFESTDLVDFAYAGRMIPYGTETQPDFAIGTGSTVKAGDTYYLYYTGHNGNPAFLQGNPRESILYATSKDLKTWTKNTSFKLTAPTGYYNFDFRDPQVFFNPEKNTYWMLISTQTSARKAVVLLYTSPDPAANNWLLEGPLYVTSEADNYLMMECADVFKMGNFWYLLFSEDWGVKGTHYRMATSSAGPWIKPSRDLLDGQFFYAAKTASDGNKRYAFGWTARKSPENDSGNKEWAGNIVAHELTQAADGTLGVKVPENIRSIFSKNIALQSKTSSGVVSVTGTTYQLNGTAAAASYTFNPISGTQKISTTLMLQSGTGSAGFLFNADNIALQHYKIALEPANNRVVAYQVSGTSVQEVASVPAALKEGIPYNIDLVMEGSVCVLYLDGKVALSNRIYGLMGKSWGVFANGTQAGFSELKILAPQ